MPDSAESIRANPDPGRGITHNFDCTHDPCQCVSSDAEHWSPEPTQDAENERFDIAGRPWFCEVCDKRMTWQDRAQELRRDGTLRYGHMSCLEQFDGGES